MTLIHRLGINGFTSCGTPGKASCYGVNVTCPKCNELDRPISRADILASIEDAAEQFREAQRMIDRKERNRV